MDEAVSKILMKDEEDRIAAARPLKEVYMAELIQELRGRPTQNVVRYSGVLLTPNVTFEVYTTKNGLRQSSSTSHQYMGAHLLDMIYLCN